MEAGLTQRINKDARLIQRINRNTRLIQRTGTHELCSCDHGCVMKALSGQSEGHSLHCMRAALLPFSHIALFTHCPFHTLRLSLDDLLPTSYR